MFPVRRTQSCTYLIWKVQSFGTTVFRGLRIEDSEQLSFKMGLAESNENDMLN
jgi:hypothetical protein